jgi:hypothetical protein
MIGLSKKSAMALFAAAMLFCQGVPLVNACVPEFSFNVIYNDFRPEMPLSQFASGNIGVLQTSYAKSYLCVAYRYLIGSPLSLREQQNILRLWRIRLTDQSGEEFERLINEVDSYLDFRKKILGKKDPEMILGSTERLSAYSYLSHISADGFVLARQRQAELIRRYGLKSSSLRDWQMAQDVVFSSAYDGKKRALTALPSGADRFLQGLRSYQIAALAFYSGDFQNAANLFTEIAADKNSSYKLLAEYLVARSKASAVLQGADAAGPDEAVKYIEHLLSVHRDVAFRQKLYDLLMPLRYQYLDRQGVIKMSASNVLKRDNERFGSDVGDLTYSLDEMSGSFDPASYSKPGADADHDRVNDLIDWLLTLQFSSTDFEYDSPEKQAHTKQLYSAQASHALERYRTKKTLPWLLAAVSLNGLRDSRNSDLLNACKAIPRSSAAYLTANYYLVDADIAAGRKDQARQNLLKLLARTDLPRGSRNLFQAQMLAVAASAEEYLRFSFMYSEKRHGYSCLPESWRKPGESDRIAQVSQCAPDPVVDDLNIHLPLDLWLKACRQNGLSEAFRARLVRTTWLRAHLLQRRDISGALSADMCRAFPRMAHLVVLCDRENGAAADLALAQLCLQNFGMTPYLDGEEARHGLEVDQFDYYNENFWVPVSLAERPRKSHDDEVYSDFAEDLSFGTATYYKDKSQWLFQKTSEYTDGYVSAGVSRVLSASQRRQARIEALELTKRPPARVFGDTVFRQINSNSADPVLPELLYRIVKLAKWSPRTHASSDYSQRAYRLLHLRYPASKWAKKTTCWY